MANSIRSQLDKSTTISEIKLLLGQDRERVCLVVEGVDDQKLFVPLLEQNNVLVFQSYSSKIGVDDIVSYEFLQNKRVIGIRDKDYESAPSCDRVFFCDYCCAEMMIVSIDSCFRRLYLNFYEHGQYNYEQLRLLCLQCLEKLSKYRMLNEQKRWAIRFDGIKPGNHYNINQVAMDKAILAEINRQNQYNTIDSKRENDCNSLSKCNALCDLLNITNGHDFIQLFCSLCKLNNRKNISISEIEISMRSVFGEESFRKTKLYRQLKQYQEQNNLTIVA